MFLKLLCLFMLAGRLNTQLYKDDICTMKDGTSGLCKPIRSCQQALDAIRKGQPPKICSFSGSDPVVCCPGTSTNEDKQDTSNSCPELPADYVKGPRTGRKALTKCIEYMEVVYPCIKSPGLSFNDEMIRGDNCGHKAVDLIVGGVDTKDREFPHMAMLGYGSDIKTAQWLCGGALISDYFVMTAGHCTYSRDFGDVEYLRLGALKRSETVDEKRIYKISDIIKHPNYKPPSKYNDIALLKSSKKITLDSRAVPVCLPVFNNMQLDKSLATGWGATTYRGSNADILQKVVLDKFTDNECKSKFKSERTMRNGFDTKTQICYGHKTESRDTCQGDSGGPLQIYNDNVKCMYTIIGVTSFGKACGFAGNPGVYTKVDNYISWIESVVWP